jgi:predicted acyl esterase
MRRAKICGLLGDNRLVRSARVQVYVTGERTGGGWRQLSSWPPPAQAERRLWLGERRQLQVREPGGIGAPDRYRYDPADPTPSLGCFSPASRSSTTGHWKPGRMS